MSKNEEKGSRLSCQKILEREYENLKVYSSTILQSKMLNRAKKSIEFKSTINSFIKNLQERNVKKNVFMENMLEGTDLSDLDFLEQVFINTNIPLCDKDSCIDDILDEVIWLMDVTIKDLKLGDKKEAYIDLTNTIFRMYKFRIAFKCLRRYFLIKNDIDFYKEIDKELKRIYFKLGKALDILKEENNF